MPWHYYDNDGQKQGPYSGGQLQWFARQGTITPETIIETEGGKSVRAKEVKGLTFGEAAPPSGGVSPFRAAPAVGVNPFTVPVPAIKQTVPPCAAVPVPVAKKSYVSFLTDIACFLFVVGAIVTFGIIGMAIYNNEMAKKNKIKRNLPSRTEEQKAETAPADEGDAPVAVPVVQGQAALPERQAAWGGVMIDPPRDIETARARLIPPHDDGVYYFNSTCVARRDNITSYLYIDNNNTTHWRKSSSFHQLDGAMNNYFKVQMENVRSVYNLVRIGEYGLVRIYDTGCTFYFIKTNNELWAMGTNAEGQVGDDTGLHQSEPVLIMHDVANLYFKRHDFEGDAIYALKTDKSRWGWGKGIKAGQTVYAPIKIDNNFNHNQQLLASHISESNLEVYPLIDLPDEITRQLGGRNNIATSIKIGDDVSRFYAITKDGTLWGWGHNNGALGDGTRATRDKPVKIAENAKRLLQHNFITQSNDRYRYSNNRDYTPEKVPDGNLDKGVILEDIKRSSIVRASDGQVIYPRPEQLVPQ